MLFTSVSTLRFVLKLIQRFLLFVPLKHLSGKFNPMAQIVQIFLDYNYIMQYQIT